MGINIFQQIRQPDGFFFSLFEATGGLSVLFFLKSRYPEIEMSTRMMRRDIWVQRTPEEGAEESIRQTTYRRIGERKIVISIIYLCKRSDKGGRF